MRNLVVAFVVGLFEHAFFVIAGFVLMVVGLGLSVTMIMLPVGPVLGLLGGDVRRRYDRAHDSFVRR